MILRTGLTGGLVAALVWGVAAIAIRLVWRAPIPTVLLFTGSGMAFGGWFAGAIYDAVGFYAAAYIDHAGRAKIRPGKFLFASPNEFDWFGCGLRKTRCFDRYLTRMFASVG